ncbi:MAG: hypothetical protein R3284_01670 [Rubricoccaceae bacterium]|nr:hypothetical protein [Rubricoccaceae bacterium]
MTTGYGFEIVVRDIAAGEELTDDYGYLNLEQPFEVFPEKGTKRTTILPDDLVRFHPEWDRQLEKAFRYLTHVEQPLAQLLDSDMWETVVAVAEGREDMLSILNCYYAGGNGQLANRLARD